MVSCKKETFAARPRALVHQRVTLPTPILEWFTSRGNARFAGEKTEGRPWCTINIHTRQRGSARLWSRLPPFRACLYTCQTGVVHAFPSTFNILQSSPRSTRSGCCQPVLEPPPYSSKTLLFRLSSHFFEPSFFHACHKLLYSMQE